MFSKYSLLGNTVESVRGEITFFMRALGTKRTCDLWFRKPPLTSTELRERE